MHSNCFHATRCIRATLFRKTDDLQFASLRGHVLIRKTPLRVQGLCSVAQAEPLDYGIMNPRRFATVAAPLCATVGRAGWVVAWLAGCGSSGIENTGAVPIEDRAPSLTADAELADAPQATAMGNAAVANAAELNQPGL